MARLLNQSKVLYRQILVKFLWHQNLCKVLYQNRKTLLKVTELYFHLDVQLDYCNNYVLCLLFHNIFVCNYLCTYRRPFLCFKYQCPILIHYYVLSYFMLFDFTLDRILVCNSSHPFILFV